MLQLDKPCFVHLVETACRRLSSHRYRPDTACLASWRKGSSREIPSSMVRQKVRASPQEEQNRLRRRGAVSPYGLPILNVLTQNWRRKRQSQKTKLGSRVTPILVPLMHPPWVALIRGVVGHWAAG